jgi:uncharacterized membrane protein YozB (DUF420 family)
MNRKYILEYSFLFLVILLTITGFWKIYFGEDSHPTLYHHLHVITNFTWLMLLLYQLNLIAKNEFSHHRKIGISVLFIAPLLFATTALLSVHSAHKGLVSGKGDFLLVQNVTVTLELGLLIALAFVFKKNRNLHGAFLMSTIVLFMGIALFFSLLSFVPLFKIEGPETFYRFGTSFITASCVCLATGVIFFLKSRKYGWPLLMAGLFPFLNELIKQILTGFNQIQPLAEAVGFLNPFGAFFGSFFFLFVILISTGIRKMNVPNRIEIKEA